MSKLRRQPTPRGCTCSEFAPGDLHDLGGGSESRFGGKKRCGVGRQPTGQSEFHSLSGSVTTSVTVTDQAPLLDTGNASLGTDVTNEYVRDIPLINRSFFGLVFLSGGVTETAGQGTAVSYPCGTNFVSNGQRTPPPRCGLMAHLPARPEQGEGATTNVYYQPSVEIVQEFKVENNSFSSDTAATAVRSLTLF